MGQDGDDLVEVAVTSGAGDSVIAGQRGDIDVLAEPAQTQYRLVEAGQRPAGPAGAASAAFGVQQSAQVLGQIAGHVEYGTIADHGELPGPDLIFANPVLPGAPRPSSRGPALPHVLPLDRV